MSEEQQTENAVTTTQQRNITAGADLTAIIPRDVEEAWRLSGAIVTAGLVPKSYEGRGDRETRSKVMIGVMKGMEVGLPPITALSTIAIINNRPSLWGDGAMALVQRSGLLEYSKEWIEGEPTTDGWTAHCELKRHGQAEAYHRTFTFGQAKRAKLTNKPGPWMAYPERMLQMRARAFAMRDGFADVLSGLSIAEEVQDIPTKAPTVSTSFLDDDAPEDAPALEYQPNPEATAYRAATDGREALSSYLESLDDDARNALPVDELFAVAEAADNERQADADPSEDAEAA